MPYAVKTADGTEREYKLEDIIAGAATGELRGEWLVRRIGDDTWMSIKTLLHIREDGRRLLGGDEAPVPDQAAHEGHLAPVASPQDTTPIILQPRISKVGGWLILLILGLAFGAPGSAQRNIKEMGDAFAPYTGRVPSLRTALHIYSYLQWGVALISIYCAYVLAFRKPGAVTVAKRGFIFMSVLAIAANFSIPLLAMPRNATMEPQAVAEFLTSTFLGPLVFLAIWYTYLVRSKRVRDTYAA